MAGFTDILGSLMQGGMAKSSTNRMTNAFGAGGGGSLNDIVGSLGKMLGGGANQSQAGGLGGMLGNVMGGLANNKAALGGLGALGGALLGGGSGSAKGAIGGGALAMLASVAFSALKNAGQQPETPAVLRDADTPEQEQKIEEDAHVLVKAMINAAKADGAIDQTELQRIIGKLEVDGLSQDEKNFFISESSRPLDLEGVIASAGGHPELAAQIYAASLLAIEVDTPQEEEYMQKLADGLKLSPATVTFIEQTLTK